MNFHAVQSTVYIIFVLMSTTVLCRDGGAIVYKITNTNTNKGPPIVTEGNSSVIIVQPRDNVELSCPIISTPPSMYEWYKENPYETSQERIFGPSQLWQRFELTSQGHLKIRSVTHEDSGTYICKAVNGFGAKSFSTKLAVTGDDPFKNNLLKSSANRRSNSNESISVPEINREQLPKRDSTSRLTNGSSLFLKCEAKGNPKPNITWFKGDKVILESKDSVLVLKLTNLMENDSGRYRCESVNIFGKDMVEVMVQVQGSWHRGDEILELKPDNLTLYAGGSGNITCVARSESVFPWFFWLKKVENATASYNNNRLMDNTNANTNDTGVFNREGVYYKVLRRSEGKEIGKHVYSTELILTNVSNSDAGVYYCAVLGLMGFNYSEARVSVGADPRQVERTLMNKQKAAAVQWAILWVFAFLIVAVLLVFCLVRLYGCRSPLKKTPVSTPEKRQGSSTRSCPTLASTLNQQREVFQPLMHTSTPSSSYRKSQSRTQFNISVNTESRTADSESCHCQCIYNASGKPSCPLIKSFYTHKMYRPPPCHSPVTSSMSSSSSCHDYTIPLPYVHHAPPPSSESNFYDQRKIFHPNRGHYYYHHLRRSNGSDVSSSLD